MYEWIIKKLFVDYICLQIHVQTMLMLSSLEHT